jgi:hypothetical protein
VNDVASSSSDLLVTRLRGLQRRATLVLFAQALCLSGGVSLLIGDALIVGGAVHNVTAAVAMAATAALLTAAAATILLRPGLRDIAASIDARLHLQDRLVTALQFNAAVDPFSQLVVRDAHARVASIRASDAVPFALPRSIRATSTAAAIVLAVMIVVTTGPRWSPAGWPGFGGPGATANAARAAGPTSNAARQQPNPATGASIAADNGTERSSAGQQPAANQAEATTPSTQVRSLSEIAPPSSGGTERLERGSRTSGDAASTDTDTNTPDDTGVAGVAASTSYEQRGGGVANGARSARPTGAAAPPDDSTYRAAYRSARAAAESAVGQDRVPADLRSYVRDYFVAIRPAGDK